MPTIKVELKHILGPSLKVSSVRVSDSDGLTVVINVRIFGCDAPEYGQRGHRVASNFIYYRMVDAKECKIQPISIDCYERSVAKVFVDGKDLAELLVKEGLAWAIDEKYVKFEQEAREKKCGIWRWENPEPPWEYRERTGKTGRRNISL